MHMKGLMRKRSRAPRDETQTPTPSSFLPPQHNNTSSNVQPPIAELDRLRLTDSSTQRDVKPQITSLGDAFLSSRRARQDSDKWGIYTEDSYSPSGTVSESAPDSPMDDISSDERMGGVAVGLNTNTGLPGMNMGNSPQVLALQPSTEQTALGATIAALVINNSDKLDEMDDDDDGDTRSVCSFHSSKDSETILREVHGRMLPAKCEVYMLPVDLEEHQRLDLEQAMLLNLAGGYLYHDPALVESVLNRRSRGRPMPAIIDVGSGSGSWCISMALQYPELEVLGVDLAPPHPNGDIPPNCRFEIDDANLGFCHYAGCYDLVHSRNTALGITDYDTYILELVQMLRPGGILMMAECDYIIYGPDKRPIIDSTLPNRPGQSWTAYVFSLAFTAMKLRRSTVDASARLPKLIMENPDLDSMTSRSFFIPIGGWGGPTPEDQQRGHIQHSVVIELMKAFRPLLLSSGHYFASIDEYITMGLRELEHREVNMFMQWHYAWATRRES